MFFLLKVLFRNIPWFDETLTNDEILKVSNNMSNDSLWQKIEGDFQVAVNDLPPQQPGNPEEQTSFQQKPIWPKHCYIMPIPRMINIM